MSDPHFTLDPGSLGFIPKDAWVLDSVPFGQIVQSFFRKRNSMHCKFPYKLFNALVITDRKPHLYPLIGVKWVTSDVFLVEKVAFARLLGVRTIDGSFFHQQGNFPSHGFVELSFQEGRALSAENGLGEVDSTNMRFLRHASNGFTRSDTDLDLTVMRWIRA
jgi:hypothetical protein